MHLNTNWSNRIGKLTFICLMSVQINLAFAENWNFASASSSAKYWLDIDSIRANGNLRQAWVVADFPFAPLGADRSAKILLELDCNGYGYRTLYTIGYDFGMTKGNVMHDSNTANASWDMAPPKSNYDNLRQFVCQLKPNN